MRRFMSWAGALALVSFLHVGSAGASADTFAIGDGHLGALNVSALNTVVNSYARVSASVVAGSTSVSVATTAGFSVGDLVLLVEVTGLSPKPASGSPAIVNLATSSVGRWELARVSAVTASSITFKDKLVNGFAINVAQVVKVPEYTNVTVNVGASITGKKWDGDSGGIVAFLATGTITNNGRIIGSELGFRGGEYVNEGSVGCALLDEPTPRGAGKGENVAAGGFGISVSGFGNIANGGGGGVCHNSGGGGGGHGGPGGRGGRTWSGDGGGRDVGGRGGAKVTYSMLDHLAFGGGAGGGHGNNSVATTGGRGGGIVFIRGGSLAGNGIIESNGQTPGSSGNDGGGGGGAGGALYLRFQGAATCNKLEARGGGGSSLTTNQHGPGGGGGGGRILVQTSALAGTCLTSVKAGFAGTQTDAGWIGGIYGGAEPAGPDILFDGPVDPAPAGGFCGTDAMCGSGKVCNVAAGVCVTGPADTGPADTGPADTGPADTGPADTGPTDTGPADTGTPDTTVADTAVTDTAPADTTVPDTTVATDTAVPDTTVVDTAVTETLPPDTTVEDTGTAVDTAVEDTGTVVEDTGSAEDTTPPPLDTGSVDDTGSAPVDTGAAEDTGPVVNPGTGEEGGGGCGCEVPGTPNSNGTYALVGAGALAAVLLRRRRRN